MEHIELAIKDLREIHGYLQAHPTEYHGSLPGFASHAADYSSDTKKLRRYADIAVKGRILFFLSIAYIKTSFCLEIYFDGLATANPFSLLFSTRAQIELFAVVFEIVTTIKQNAGNQGGNFAERVTAVDEALITATYGTRDERAAEIIDKLGASRLRPKRDRDAEILGARNIITRIEKLSKTPAYERLVADYYRLCDYLHPNFAQNVLLAQKSPMHEKAVKITRDHPGIMETALDRTAQAMALAADGTVRELNTIGEPFPNVGT